GAWKVVYHYFPSEASENSHYQLFNLADDPFESENLASSRPAELRRMMQGLIASLEKHQAVYPVDNDGTTRLKPRLPGTDISQRASGPQPRVGDRSGSGSLQPVASIE
ncbi:MAG: hypothetical protein WD941_07595, partial [Opitutus sp.]